MQGATNPAQAAFAPAGRRKPDGDLQADSMTDLTFMKNPA